MFRFPLFLILCLVFGPKAAIWGQVSPDSVSNSGQKKGKLVNVPINSDSTKQRLTADSIVFPVDSTLLASDTSGTDTLITQKPGYSVSNDSIEAPITYKARDSIVYDLIEEKVYLYGEASVKYQSTELKAHFITLDWANNMIIAVTDSADGEPIGDVLFIDVGGEYKSKRMMYNYRTKKGHVTMARTQEGEGFMIIGQGKRNEREELYGADAKYTTCELEDPHFYFKSKKVKVVPDKVMVTGPANLVVHDVPTPLVLPFGIFPTKKGRRSGIIMPRYGEQPAKGFYLQEGGYYFSINDYIDLALTADFFTDLSWAARASTRYAMRYRFMGDASFKYGRNRNGDPDAPDFYIINDFRFNWNHRQDSKARPNSQFSANVNFGTSSFNKNFTTSQQSVTQSLLVSKVSYSRSFGSKPLSMSVNLNHDQNLQTGAVNLTLPEFRFGVSRINPFKPKKATGKKKWYETVGFSYTFDTKNSINAIDSTFISTETLKNMRYGARHNVPISASFPVFKYFTLTPNFTYTERWYFQTVDKNWDPTLIITAVNDSTADTTFGRVITDTITKFAPARDFSMGVGLTTNLYGYLKFKKGKLKAIRHKMTPTLSFRYRPDFGDERWGYFDEVQTDRFGNKQRYSLFEPVSSLYGAPPDGAEMGIGLGINNNLEMKVFSKKDTVNHEKKIKILENLSISTFYNFVADSLKLSPIQISGFTTLFDVLRLNFGTTLDPYVYDSTNRKINTFVWQDRKRLTQMRSATISLSTSLRSKKGGNQPLNNDPYDERNMILAAPDLYYDFTIPWSIGIGYNLSLSRGVSGNPDTVVVSSNSLTLDLDVTLTPKWKIVVNSGYDFKARDLVYTTVRVIRNMHCWELSFFWVPYPIDRMNYNMQLNVKSAILQELKLSRKSGAYSAPF